HIARELHDEVGQMLTGLKLTLDLMARQPAEAAARAANAGRAATSLRERPIIQARQLVNALVARVRDLSLDLRPAMLDHFGLIAALLWLFERYTAQTGIAVSFEHDRLERRFASEIETAAYRIVQEALTNVARHAAVSQVTVRAWADDRTVSVQIVDAGCGFDPEEAR